MHDEIAGRRTSFGVRTLASFTAGRKREGLPTTTAEFSGDDDVPKRRTVFAEPRSEFARIKGPVAARSNGMIDKTPSANPSAQGPEERTWAVQRPVAGNRIARTHRPTRGLGAG